MAEIKSSWAVCSVCGKEFEIVGNRKKYCSKACCAEASRKKSCERGKARYKALTAEQKKDHEKKDVETEFTLCVLIIEADTHTLKHEEEVVTNFKSMDAKKAEILKKYCSEHDGKYYAISERRCVVKE